MATIASCIRLSREATVIYGLPEKPNAIPDRDFRQFNFDEGLYLGLPVAMFQLFRYLRRNRHKYDFIHFYSTLLLLLGPYVARLAGVPAIITITGFGRAISGSSPWLRWTYLRMLRLAVRSSEAVLFQNSSDMEWIQSKFRLAPGKLCLIGSGVALEPARPEPNESGPLTVVLVSRVMPAKGIDDFLHVARELQSEDFRFVLVGPMSTGNEALYKRCEDSSAAGIIDFRGPQTFEQTVAALDDADVFYFPSTYAEGLARVMIEAGYQGLCPIAYEIPSNLDLVPPMGGYLTAPGDTGTVIELLCQLNRDRQLLYRNAVTFQAHIVSGYNMDAFTAKMDTLLLSLVME